LAGDGQTKHYFTIPSNTVTDAFGKMYPTPFPALITDRFADDEPPAMTLPSSIRAFSCACRSNRPNTSASGSYICHTTSTAHYRANQIDFIAASVIPADVWYILPAAALQGKHMICLSPHRKTSKYRRYREAWHLLRAKPAKARKAASGR
jgi:hypothetical protein